MKIDPCVVGFCCFRITIRRVSELLYPVQETPSSSFGQDVSETTEDSGWTFFITYTFPSPGLLGDDPLNGVTLHPPEHTGYSDLKSLESIVDETRVWVPTLGKMW